MITVIIPERQFVAVCKKCGSVLGYTYSDTVIHKYKVTKGFLVGYGAYRCITCPICNSRVRHEGDK